MVTLKRDQWTAERFLAWSAGLILALLLSFLGAVAQAQEKPTVSSLLQQGYEVVGVFPSNAGPGILLADDNDGVEKLMMCFVAETTQSPDITTQYCKTVR